MCPKDTKPQATQTGVFNTRNCHTTIYTKPAGDFRPRFGGAVSTKAPRVERIEVMRLLTPLLVLLLIGSLIVNGITVMKLKNKRPIFSVNGQGVTKKDLDDFLENKEGPAVKAEMVRRMIVDQEAKKQNVSPTEADVNDTFETQKEDNWQFAFNVNRSPWTSDETKKDIKMRIEATNLTLNGIKVEDSEIQEAYTKQAPLFDTPDKAIGSLAVISEPGLKDPAQDLERIKATTQQVITNLGKTPPVSPAAIMSQFQNQVFFIGNDYKYTFKRYFQFKGNYPNKQLVDLIYAMKPGEVKQLPLTKDIYQVGGRALVFKLLEVVPGKKANLSDPKTKENIRKAVASKRAKPFEEVLAKIWGATDFQSDNPDDKKQIEAMLLPSQKKAQ